MKTINVPMSARESLLNVSPNESGMPTPDAHRGLWFACDPVEVNDDIDFVCCGDVIAKATVTELLTRDDVTVKLCSGINQFGFRWKERN